MRFDKIPIIVSDPHLYLENNERSFCRAIQMTDAYNDASRHRQTLGAFSRNAARANTSLVIGETDRLYWPA